MTLSIQLVGDVRALFLNAFFLLVAFEVREDAASEGAESAIATVDHSDIRGSEPHNRDPSGAASD
jgi:hypothetical protein